MTLAELLQNADGWHVDEDEPWRVRAGDVYPVAFCGTLPGHPDPNPKRAERCAELIALAPDLARLALDMGEALRHPSIPPAFYREHSRGLLARLDGIANKDEAA